MCSLCSLCVFYSVHENVNQIWPRANKLSPFIYLRHFELLEELNCLNCLLSKQENILLLIELKYKLVQYNKLTVYDIYDMYNIWYSRFIKTLFWTFKLCWNISVKNADIGIFVLLKRMDCLIYPLYNLITFSKLISHAFLTPFHYNKIESVNILVKKADVIKFLPVSWLQNVYNSVYNKLSYMHTMFHGPCSSRSNFR